MWESFLKPDVVDWLLEPVNPSVRFLALTRILDEPESSLAAREARREIMRQGLVPRVLARERYDCWNEPGQFYRDKYRGTVWQLIILAEHLADGSNPQIHAACEYLFECCQDRESSGFAVDGSPEQGGRHSEVIPCLTGNMVWSLIRFGYLEDPRVQRAIDWISRYQRFADGDEEPPEGWPYDRFEMCWGRHTCHMGAVKALKALAAVPEDRRSESVRETISAGCEHLLKHHIHKKSHDLAQVAKPGWLRLQFPLMYQTDILEIASILLAFGRRDERMEEAIGKIAAKQCDDGRWLLESTFNGRFQVDVEERGRSSKWITLRALEVLKGYYG